MGIWRTLTLLCLATILVDAKIQLHQKREATPNICDPVYNNTNKVLCSCEKDSREPNRVKSADCYLAVDGVPPDDPIWDSFKSNEITRLVITSAKGIFLKYIPTDTIKAIQSLKKIDLKYNNIHKIHNYAFANLSSVEEITLRDNQLVVLKVNAFAHHRNLTVINLDKNNIVEINRDVFIDLPSLEKLYLTSNNLTTIHDRAFIHLTNLKELEISVNSLFSLNSETFSGMKKLQRLDLSSNSLEVIGDNTFLPLVDLISLDLSGNKIQMLDGRAFYGLPKLQFLSLAQNNLTNIDNVKLFEGLKSMISLSLKGNQIRELKADVMAPIIKNFYKAPSTLDVEDNNFPCDCRLDWFISLMNKIENKQLKLTLENFKCIPSAELRELWNKTDVLKGDQIVEDTQNAADYEYYDDTQLDGKLFYVDARDLLNCTTVIDAAATNSNVNLDKTSKPAAAAAYDKKTTVTQVTKETISIDKTTKTPEVKVDEVSKVNLDPTTSRLATVSANPINKNKYEDMASDEAVPDKIKSHRSIQDADTPKFNYSNGVRNVGCVMLVFMILFIRLI